MSMTNIRRVLLTFSLLSLGVAVAWAASGEKVKQIDGKYVCMITKKQFKTEQESVSIEGRTYHYCCEMCKTQLQNDPKARMDKDPVSGKEVDKATAVVGVDKAGHVYFFESVENLNKFRVPAATQE